MRIGIDYRFLSVGVSIVNRGMGRYTQQQLRETLKVDERNEYVLFCKPGADLSLILPEIRTAPNVSIASIRCSQERLKGDPNSSNKVLRYTEEYQTWIYEQRVDIYHSTTPFLLGGDVVLPHFDVCPFVATFYDAIPLIFEDRYLSPGSSTRDLWLRALHFIKRADRLIAISQSAKHDAKYYAGFPEDRIDLAYPIADPWFQVLPPEQVETSLAPLRSRCGFTKEFAMSVSGTHHSKNIEILFAAYALIPLKLRQQMPLMLVCHLSEEEKYQIRLWARKYGVEENVIIPGFVTEDEMVALYNATTMVIHPSLYEGFGLPILEALRCGSPVIASSTSSMPEVGGDAVIYVDPNDAQDIANAIETLYLSSLSDKQEMKLKGLEQARKFTTEQLGRNTLAAYEKASHEMIGDAKKNRSSRLALWSPLPPQQSGVADYCADLLPELSKLYDLEIFVDDGYVPIPSLLNCYCIQHFSAFERRQSQRPFDGIIYQIGASPFHIYMYDILQKYAGLVVLHDLTWGYALYSHFLSKGQHSEFKQEILELEGAEALALYEQIDRPNLFSPAVESFLNCHYMLQRIANACLGLVVHTESLADELRELYPHKPVYTIHLMSVDPWQGQPVVNRDYVRLQLGIDSRQFIVGVFGIVDRVKRVEVCLEAFHHLLKDYPESQFFLVGNVPDANYQASLRSLAESLGISVRVHFFGHVASDLFDRLLICCDVVVNLRYPSRKQMSATLARTLATGCPVIITNLPEWDFIPPSFCWRVAPDQNEIAHLAEYLRRLALDPSLRQRLSAHSMAYFEAEGTTIAQMATHYATAATKLFGTPVPQLDREDPPVVPLHFNNICNLEDFNDPELRETIRDVFRHEARHFPPDFPQATGNRKYWETAMSVRALRNLGAIRPDAVILGVGAGAETAIFYLTNQVRQVFATDMYFHPGAAENLTHTLMLLDPTKVAPYVFDRSRLIVQHMDGRLLNYPNNTFDGIFSSSSIGYFGELDFVANAAFEMGRVLKPGGVLTLSTDYCFSSPPGGKGWDGRILFSKEDLQHYVVEASGLELVDDLQVDVSSETLSLPRPLSDANGGEIVSSSPHLIVTRQGYVFGPIHLTLRKSDKYPVFDNEWARPSPATMKAVRERTDSMFTNNGSLVSEVEPPQSQQEIQVSVLGTAVERIGANNMSNLPRHPLISLDKLNHIRDLFNTWQLIRVKGWHNRVLQKFPKPLAYFARAVLRLMYLGHAQEMQARLYNAVVDYQKDMTDSVRDIQLWVDHLLSHDHDVASQLTLLRGQTERITTLETQLQNLNSQLITLQNSTERIVDLEKSTRLLDDRFAGLDKRNLHLESDLLETQTQVHQVVGRLDGTESQVQQAVGRLDGIESQVQQSAWWLEKAEVQVQQTAGRLDKMESQVRQAVGRLDGVEGESQRTAVRLKEVEAQTQQVAGQLERSKAESQQMAGRLDEVKAQVQQAVGRLESQGQQSSHSLLALEGYVAGVKSDVQGLDVNLRDTISRVRLLNQQFEISSGIQSQTPSTFILSAEDMRHLFRSLDETIPALKNCKSVEVSIQGLTAESILLSIVEHFGDRMSSKGSNYRVPNDLWYHIDFTPQWDRPILFESAQVRLSPGGFFVMVTDSKNVYKKGSWSLEIVFDLTLTLHSNRQVVVYVFQK